MRIGVIADTHGHLAAGALEALTGVELILHAGDIGKEAVLDALARVAPVLAVRGNTDAGTALGRAHPATRWLEREGARIFMTHIGGRPAELAAALPDDPAARPDVYIFGHTHVALLEREGGVLFLNPGAAGYPRFGGGLSVAVLEVEGGAARATIVPLA
ncbi:MAG TPA: metallophosphoesterase family protein [Chloroflexaceae bacterium]|nr:metallophosphoesterase family protein [Chloroflexaceae bacterium]